MTKKFLSEQNIPYKEIDVTEDQKALEELVEVSGSLAVPVITVDGHVIVGFDREHLKTALGM